MFLQKNIHYAFMRFYVVKHKIIKPLHFSRINAHFKYIRNIINIFS
jgi:hypothetical protein